MSANSISADESAAIATAKDRLRARTPRLTTTIKFSAEGAICEIGPEHHDRDGWLIRLEDAFGTRGTAFAISQLNSLMRACQDTAGKVDTVKLNGMLAAIQGAQPSNEIQAMLAVQMAMTHAAATDVLRRAQRVDQIPQVDSAGNLAVKLLRTFTMQVEALAKLQRGGEQIVKVVHVHPGAQAVIGNLTTGTSGGTKEGGGTHENGNQPHAKAQIAADGAQPMPEVWSEDAERQPVPFASRQGSSAVPDARRRER